MTISATTVATRTNTNGVTHTFSFGYPWLDPDDLVVALVTLADWSIALQVKDTNYTVSNTGDEDVSGGTITFINHLAVPTAPADGKVCVIVRKPVMEQDYNPGSIYEAAQGETALDRIYQQLQYLKFRSDRSIHLNDAFPDATVEIPDPTARASKALVFDSSGNLTVGVTGADVLAGSEAAQAAAEAAAATATTQASAATTAASAATTAQNLAEEWASKVNGIVNGEDYSSKAYAIGGSGVTGGAGAAKEWANRTDANVDGTDPSAKSWALGGTPTTGVANRGSAKDWATKTDGSPATAEYSAKAYAIGGTGVDGGAGSAKDWADKTNGAVDGAGTGFSAKAWSIGGTSVSGTASRGAAKEWATKTDGNVDTSDASAKAWAVGGVGVTDTAGRGSAKEWAVNPEDDLVDGTEYSAKHYAAKALAEYQNAAAVSENPAITYNFDALTADADPGNGEFRIDNASYASATFVYLDNVDHFGNSLTAWLDTFDDANTTYKGLLLIRDVTDPLAFAIYRVTGTVTTASTYRKVPVTAVQVGSGTFSGLTSVMFIPSSDFPTLSAFDLGVTGDGSVPNAPSAAGVYFGKDASNTNRRIEIVSPTNGSSYIDFTNPSTDFLGRILYDTQNNIFKLAINGTEELGLSATALYPVTNDGLALGTSTLRWSDADFADGAVIRWNNSYTMTHSTGLLTLSGALSIGTSNVFTAGTIELGAVGDTTLSRLAAGRVAVEGNELIRADRLASTSNALGASLVGIEDAGGIITATTVEGALAEIKGILNSLDQAVILKGTWDASGGTFPGSGAAQAGWSYIVSVGGTVDSVVFNVGDRIVAILDNASTSTFASNWFKADYTDLVTSVAGKTGIVTIQLADITDMSANGRSLTATTYSGMKTLLAIAQADVTGLTTADSPQFTAVNIGGTDCTITRPGAGDLSIEGNIIYRAGGTDVPVTDGGTGASSASAAFDNLKQTATTISGGVQELATDAEVRSAATGALSVTAAHLESAAATVALTDAAPVAVDWDTGINFTLTVTTNRTIGNPTNGQPGTYRTILVQGNDGTDRTITFGNQYGGEIPGLTDVDNVKKYLLTIYCKSSTQFLVTAIDGSDA